MKTGVEFFKLRVQAIILSKVSQSDRDIIEHFFMQAKELEKQQMAEAFYAPANEAEPTNFNEYYKQKYEDESKSNN